MSQASSLDKKWFGEYGISAEELEKYISEYPDGSLAVVQDDTLLGFATFEILEHRMPKDYVGDIELPKKVMFIQQFTTTTNYKIENSEMDEVLLSAVEKKAKELGCSEIWEALAIDHPYKKENKSDFDAFGFYESHGFSVDKN